MQFRGFSLPKIVILSIFLVNSTLVLMEPLSAQETGSLEERITRLEKMIYELRVEVDQFKGGNPSSSSDESKQKPPSEEIIKKAIAEQLKKQVPMSWAGSTMGGKNTKINQIEIKQIGTFSEQEEYWPVRARVKGTCTVKSLMPNILPAEQKTFDQVGDFKIYQDDYGKWKAHIGMM